MTETLLGKMKDEFFGRQGSDGIRKHRVTLFIVAESGDGPSRIKKLEIFARQGIFKTSATTWTLNDDHPDKCCGFAGKIWYSGTTEFKEAACDWPCDGNLEAKDRYAISLGVTLAEAELPNMKARAFCGTTVLVNGKKWGVLVLDTEETWSALCGTTKLRNEKERILERYAKLVGEILQEALE